MKKLISLLLIVGLISTMLVACKAEEETRETVDYSQYMLGTVDELLEDLGYKTDDVTYYPDKENYMGIYLPGTEMFMGYECQVFIYLDVGTGLVSEYEYRLEFEKDVEGAVETFENIMDKISEAYGEKDTHASVGGSYSEYDDPVASLKSGVADNHEKIIEDWALSDYGYDEIEEKLTDYYTENYSGVISFEQIYFILNAGIGHYVDDDLTVLTFCYDTTFSDLENY